MNYRIDSSLSTHLPMCGCGWRGDPAPTRLGAIVQLSRHQHRAHPDESHSLENLRRRSGLTSPRL